MNRKDKSEIKSKFLRKHWDLASEMYHSVENALKQYDLENPSSLAKSDEEASFEGTIFDLTLIIEAFENAWCSLYKSYLLEGIREDVLDFFYQLQTGTLEAQVAAPYEIKVIDIEYDLSRGFDLSAKQSDLLYPWENYKAYQPEIEYTNDTIYEKQMLLNRICEEVYEELGLLEYDDLEESVEEIYGDFSSFLTEDKRLDFTHYIEFMRDCWAHTRGKTGANVLGFLFTHSELHYTSLDDYNFSKTIASKDEAETFKEYLRGKGIF
jgi:hypothetical protein